MKTRAQRIHRFGGPDVIVLESIDLPRPGPGEALVHVRAAGVGPWDALIRSGKSALPQPLPLTLGADLSGVVLDVGLEAGSLVAGIEVFGVTNGRFTGAYADYAVVDAHRIIRKPHVLDFVQAASAPVVSVTAWTMLFERGHLTPGMRVLVHGAAGSVGAYAVQMAHHAGAIVVALGRADDAERLRALGADVVIDYAAAPFETVVEPVDLVLDTIGGEMQTRSFGVLRAGGALLSIVQPPDQALVTQHNVRAEFFVIDVTARSLETVAALFADGTIAPNVGVVLPLAEAQQAHVLLEHPAPGQRGKIVLTVS